MRSERNYKVILTSFIQTISELVYK